MECQLDTWAKMALSADFRRKGQLMANGVVGEYSDAKRVCLGGLAPVYLWPILQGGIWMRQIELFCVGLKKKLYLCIF